MQLINEFDYIKVQEMETPILEEYKDMIRGINLKTNATDFFDADILFENLLCQV
jgi:hypothetical protein